MQKRGHESLHYEPGALRNARIHWRTARIAVGFESTMEINLPSLTNPKAHKAAVGTERRVNYIEASKSYAKPVIIFMSKKVSRCDIHIHFFITKMHIRDNS